MRVTILDVCGLSDRNRCTVTGPATLKSVLGPKRTALLWPLSMTPASNLLAFLASLPQKDHKVTDHARTR